MLRRVVAIYFVLVTAAGPNLCCCSLTHVFARPHDEKTPSCCTSASAGEAPRERQADRREKGNHTEKPCCPCCDKASEPAPGDGERAHHPSQEQDRPRGKSHPQKPGCPCRDEVARPALLARAVETADHFQAVSFLTSPPLPTTSGAFSSVNGVAALPGEPGPSFLTAGDLLHVHHQLRC